ncbi:hypothetical protein JF540_24095 [Salipiger thiooxidans]|uniref:hypothetical protein n=1 Tax=Salipiger thiooxidans TaxID=282683 RepID=UPI001A8C3E68|nr:hypothetical protein [Salipiger thiooxidans]MBN8189774.1 hypothetical protein [Salipiger thiooxidans]
MEQSGIPGVQGACASAPERQKRRSFHETSVSRHRGSDDPCGGVAAENDGSMFHARMYGQAMLGSDLMDMPVYRGDDTGTTQSQGTVQDSWDEIGEVADFVLSPENSI